MWRVFYEDGVFSSTQGPAGQAPSFGVLGIWQPGG